MVEFTVDEGEGQFFVSSPQLPGWKCGGFTRVHAETDALFSLCEYLRAKPRLKSEIKKTLVRMVGNP